MPFRNLTVRTLLHLSCSRLVAHAQAADLVLQPPELRRGDIVDD